jgi:hypothetical protein
VGEREGKYGKEKERREREREIESYSGRERRKVWE